MWLSFYVLFFCRNCTKMGQKTRGCKLKMPIWQCYHGLPQASCTPNESSWPKFSFCMGLYRVPARSYMIFLKKLKKLSVQVTILTILSKLVFSNVKLDFLAFWHLNHYCTIFTTHLKHWYEKIWCTDPARAILAGSTFIWK